MEVANYTVDRFSHYLPQDTTLKPLVLSLVESMMDNKINMVEHYCLAILEVIQELKPTPKDLKDVKVGDLVTCKRGTSIIEVGCEYEVIAVGESFIDIDTGEYGVLRYPRLDIRFSL